MYSDNSNIGYAEPNAKPKPCQEKNLLMVTSTEGVTQSNREIYISARIPGFNECRQVMIVVQVSIGRILQDFVDTKMRDISCKIGDKRERPRRNWLNLECPL